MYVPLLVTGWAIILTRQGLFVISLSAEPPNGSYQDKHFLESLSLGIGGNLLCFCYFPLKNVVDRKPEIPKLALLPQGKIKESLYILCTSLGLRLRQDCRFKHFASYLHVA